MNQLYEYDDMLNSPVEAFYLSNDFFKLPVEAHWHYYIEVLYVLKGHISVISNDSTYNLGPKELIFLPPQSVHAVYGSNKESFCYGVLKFDGNRIHLSDDYLPKISTIFRSTSLQQHLPITFSQEDFGNFSLEYFFEDCVSEIRDKKYGYDSYLLSTISRFVLLVLRLWREKGFSQQADSFEKKDDYSIHDILMYIDSHSQDNISVNELAAKCNMSYSYFAKTFHKLYGQSCKQYIEFVRLCKVENLLLFTDYDLSYISNETGFSDCSHLIRVFKRKYNITPKQYRLKHRSTSN